MKFKAAVILASELLQGAGMNTDDANVSANCIVASDAWGIGSHGLMRLPFYLERLKAGGINPNAKLKEITNLPSLRIFDGERGMGHWQLKKAAEVAAKIADTQGIAAVGIGNSNHCGALGIYVWPMLEQNQVGIVFSTGPAVMPPWGGNKPLLSTSPLAAGIPTHPATVIDLATSAVARGKIAAKAQKNEVLEAGWAFDENGHPTTDAKEALKKISISSDHEPLRSKLLELPSQTLSKILSKFLSVTAILSSCSLRTAGDCPCFKLPSTDCKASNS